MSFEFGNHIRVTLFGQSHAPAVGMVLDGLSAGEEIDLNALSAFLARRRPGQGSHTTQRREADQPRFLSGLVDGRTCGAPLCAVIENTDVRSGDYAALRDVPRPGHADYPAYVKYAGCNDIRGGGQFSARLTAALCTAGGVLLQLLERRGVTIAARAAAIAGIPDDPLPDPLTPEAVAALRAAAPIPVWSPRAGGEMLAAIEDARRAGDSVGGIVECHVLGLPPGLGEPWFDGLENVIARAVFAIPAVKGIEFGAGFAAAALRGSEHNDPFRVENGRVTTPTNRHGGILGGLSTGMPLVFRCAFKPTPSIAREQDSVSLSRLENTPLTIHGRHDPCVVPRAVPCVEAAAALALADFLL